MPHEDVGNVKDLILYRLETAETNLKSAIILKDHADYKGSNNRAYYSVFHSITAIHAMEGKSYKRHKDAIANFNYNYVRTGVFPKELGRRIGRAELIRHHSDYDDFYIASKEETEALIQTARDLLSAVRAYCETKNYGEGNSEEDSGTNSGEDTTAR